MHEHAAPITLAKGAHTRYIYNGGARPQYIHSIDWPTGLPQSPELNNNKKQIVRTALHFLQIGTS